MNKLAYELGQAVAYEAMVKEAYKGSEVLDDIIKQLVAAKGSVGSAASDFGKALGETGTGLTNIKGGLRHALNAGRSGSARVVGGSPNIRHGSDLLQRSVKELLAGRGSNALHNARAGAKSVGEGVGPLPQAFAGGASGAELDLAKSVLAKGLRQTAPAAGLAGAGALTGAGGYGAYQAMQPDPTLVDKLREQLGL